MSASAARDTLVEHLGGDAVVIPNGVSVRPLRRRPSRCRAGRARAGALGFLGRIDEPRKGLPVLLAALPAIVGQAPRRAAAGGRPG